MKKLLAIFVLALIAIRGYSQTNQPPATPLISSPVWDIISHSNVLIVPYTVYDDKTHNFGAGIGLGYRLSPILVPYARFEEFDGQAWSFSGSIQLQIPIYINGLQVVPLFWTGVGVSGNTENSGNAIAILGTGVSVHLPTGKWYLPKAVLGGYERWTGGGFDNNHWLLGLGFW